MGKLTGIYRPFRKMTEDQIEKWSGSLVNLVGFVVKDESTKVKAYVDRHRNNHPGYSKETLARHIIKRRALKAGAMGGVCGFGGFLTMPVTMPANLYSLYRIQAKMVLAISHLYGWDTDDEETQMDVMLVMGGTMATAALDELGVSIGKELTAKAVDKFITRNVMKQVNKVLSRKIITKAGEKSAVTFTQLAPFVGAPIGFGIDYWATRAIGKTALKFYADNPGADDV